MFERSFIHLPASVLPLLGLALFFGVFCAVFLRVYLFRRPPEFAPTAALPLQDDVPKTFAPASRKS